MPESVPAIPAPASTPPRAGHGPILLLVLTAVLFWWPCLVGGKVPVAAVYQQQMPPFGNPSTTPTRAWDALLWDSMAQFYPWRVLLQRGLQSGELPLWNPYQYCGYPFVGNGQSALFYPPNWLLLWIPVNYFLGLSLALHWLLSGLLTYLLCRTLGLRPGAAALAGIIFETSGFMIAWCELPTVVNTMAWLPGAWLGVEWLFRRRRGGLAMVALSLGLTLLAGHLQFAAYVWLATGVYALLRGLARWVARRRAPVAALALAVVLALGVGAPQVLPTLELGLASPRGAQGASLEGWQFQKTRALLPVELVTFLFPEAAGDPVTGGYRGFSFTEHCGYAGVFAVLFALLGIAWRRDRWALLYALGAVAAVSIAMAGPLAYLLYFYVPKLGQAGNFARILGVYTLCLAVLAGMGFDRLLAWVTRHLTGTPRTRATVLAAFTILAAALILGELVPWGWRFLPLAPQAQVYPDTDTTRTLQHLGLSPRSRVLTLTSRRNWSLFNVPEALLPPNAATVYGWYSPQGYDSLSIAAYREYAAATEGAEISPEENGNMMLLNNPDSQLLDQARVTWIASLAPLSSGKLTLLKRTSEGVYLYRRSVDPFPITPGAVATGRYDHSLLVETLNTLRVEEYATQPRLLAHSTFYPGWRAFVNTRPAPAEPRGLFPSVPAFGPGYRVLWMAFYPSTVVVGVFLGLVALMLITAITVASRLPGPPAAAGPADSSSQPPPEEALLSPGRVCQPAGRGDGGEAPCP